MRLSRRRMLVLTGAGTGLYQAMAQTPAAPPAASPIAPTDPLEKAREDNRRSADNLSKFAIPMTTEPAFIFRA
jgi:hypothetical protein